MQARSPSTAAAVMQQPAPAFPVAYGDGPFFYGGYTSSPTHLAAVQGAYGDGPFFYGGYTSSSTHLAAAQGAYGDGPFFYGGCTSSPTHAQEAAALRVENTGLRAANQALAEQLQLFHLGQMALPPAVIPPMAGHLGQMAPAVIPPMAGHPGQMAPAVIPPMAAHPGAGQMASMLPPMVASPAEHLGQQMSVPVPAAVFSPAERRAMMPKSINIPSSSTACLVMPKTDGVANGEYRVKLDSVASLKSNKMEDVDGAKHKGGLWLDGFSQGTYKTELCNKWDKGATCPYGDKCQFAHGIAELRPIIRQRGWKTQVCRTVIGGAICPYGHRCHFRHSITHADLHHP